MTLIYHVYPKDQWCDPHEGMHPFVSKVDFDALAAELAETRIVAHNNYLAAVQNKEIGELNRDRIRALEATVARLESDIRCRKLSEAAAIADQAYVELTPIDDKRGSTAETPACICPSGKEWADENQAHLYNCPRFTAETSVCCPACGIVGDDRCCAHGINLRSEVYKGVKDAPTYIDDHKGDG